MQQSVIVAAGTAVLVAVVFVLWDLLKTHRRRRSRALHYRRMSTSQPAKLLARPPVRGVGPERLEFIRMEAENAARMAFMFPGQEVVNPYPDGTRECVLWQASFHLLSIELSESGHAGAHDDRTG